MNKIKLLEEEQIFGENRLKIFNKISLIAPTTDFSDALGCYGCYLSGTRIGLYWIKSNNSAYFVDGITSPHMDGFDKRGYGIRPVISYSSIKNDITNEIINEQRVKEIEYGEYPQKAISKELQYKLEELYKNNELNETGKTYTTDSRKYDEYDKGFLPQEHIEYSHENKKYIRVKVNSCYKGNSYHKGIGMSNNEEYENGDYIWIKVAPIKWLVDKENDIALSKNILISGIQFDNKEEYDGDFENTNIYKYLNTHFIKDIMPNKVNDNTIKRDNTVKLFEEYKEALLRYNIAIEKLDAIKIKYQEASEEYEDAKKAFEKIERNLPSLLEKEKNGKSKVKKSK